MLPRTACRFLVLLILAMLAAVHPAVPKASISSFPPIVVHPGESIQSAINGAASGSTIQVMNGRYEETISVDKPLTLIGEGNSTIIQNSGSSKTVNILKGVVNVTIADLLVNGTGGASSIGIYSGNNVYNRIENVTVANHEIGIELYDSSGDILHNNRMINNTQNLKIYGLFLPHFLHNIDSSNLVNGKRVYYWTGQHDKVFPTDAGYVAAINCTGMTVQDSELGNNFSGVLFAYTNSSLIRSVTCYDNEQGIRLLCSQDNIVSNTTLSSNSYAGVALCTSPNNSISGDVVKLNRFGISLSYTSLIPVYSSNNTISGSLIADNSEAGIYLVNSSNCKVFNNEIVNNGVGVEIDLWDTLSKDNTFYHNNFIDNNVSVHFMVRSSSSIPANYWNDGYPIGGNYWSGNNATDLFSGPFQNETGGDGVCDKPYDLGENNKDNLPLVHPYGSIRNLNTSLSYLTIQSAINAADTLDGHTIFVKSGVYRESILLNKKLSLIGQNRDVTVLETAPELNITTIVANNVTLCNFTLRSSWKEAPSNGIRLINACYCKILNNLIFNKFEAIKIDRGSCNNLVQNNLLRDNQYGIFIKRRPNEDAVRGNAIYNNTIVHNSWNGIELAYVEGNIIESNILADNGGFGLEIPIYTPSYDNVIFHNNFMRNSWNNYPVCQAYDYYMFHNHWDSGGEGNFWGDYRGTDLDHDGIGDLAYFITPELNEIVKDQYPLMGNYSCYVIRGNLISLISNSTITDLKFEDTYPEGRLLINVTARTSGFSRIRLPRTLLDAPYQLTFDGKPLDFWELPCSNETFECLYISYPAGDVAATHQIEIAGITQVPEYSETFLLVITFAVAVTLTCTKRLKAVRSSLSLSKERVFQVVIFD